MMRDKVRIGVFGAYRGMTMIRVLANHPDATLVAVCDKYQPALEKVRRLAEEAGLDVELYTDFDSFEKHDMDAVVLANYANEHAIYAVRLLRGGRHVLSEVLPCETMSQAVDLIEAVEDSGKVYAYAENYCYMSHSFEMWRRYEKGEIGDVMYAEGEYIHDCSSIWPAITYGDPKHWRNNIHPNFYCTHSVGPVLTITGHRPIRVSGFTTQRNCAAESMGRRAGVRAGIEIITLDNGAIVKSVHGELKREPGCQPYRIYGTKGCMETEMFPTDDFSDGKAWKQKVFVYREGAKVCTGETEVYSPDLSAFSNAFQKGMEHGGSDFYPTHYFIEKILGREEGKHYSIDVYQAVEMGIVGILAYRSVLAGGVPIEVPNLRNPEEREKWRKDCRCTNPEIAAGEDLLPCAPEGNLESAPEVYERVCEMWLKETENKQNNT